MTDQILHDSDVTAPNDFVYDVVEPQDDGSNDSSMESNPQNRILR